ncbi:hypothetical protein GCM10023078_35320 [Gibbsiella greigii]
MRPTTVGIYLLFILVAATITSLFVTTLLIRLAVAVLVYYKYGGLSFDLTDVIYSLKVGLSGGIPLGVGAWVLSSMKARKEKQPPSKE